MKTAITTPAAKPASHDTGLSLVKTLSYVVLTSILLIVLGSFFVISANARAKNRSIIEVDQQGTLIMEKMVQVTRNASAVVAPSIATAGEQLSLSTLASSVDPTVFSLSGTVFQIKEGTGAAVPLSNGSVQVSDLKFTNLTRAGTSGTVRISFTVSQVKKVGNNEHGYRKTFITTVGLRP